MKIKQGGVISLAIILFFSLLILGGCAKKEEEAAKKAAAEKVVEEAKLAAPKAPDFTLQDINGKTLTLYQVKGEAIVINFWHTHSPASKTEVPALVELDNKYRDKGLRIIGVSMNIGDDLAVANYKRAAGMNYEVCVANDKIMEAYRPGIPTTWILNRNFEIVKKIVGKTTPEELKTEIGKLIDLGKISAAGDETSATAEMRP